MAGFIITDPRNGDTVFVSGNRLLTESSIAPEIHDKSEEGEAYTLATTDTARTLTITATGGPILYFQNDGDEEFAVECIAVHSSVDGMVAVVYRNSTVGTIGNENTHTPVNLNTGSAKTADLTVYNWDEVGDGMTGITDGTAFGSHILSVGHNEVMNGSSLIVAPGGTISVSLHGAGEASIVATGYFE